MWVREILIDSMQRHIYNQEGESMIYMGHVLDDQFTFLSFLEFVFW